MGVEGKRQKGARVQRERQRREREREREKEKEGGGGSVQSNTAVTARAGLFQFTGWVNTTQNMRV